MHKAVNREGQCGATLACLLLAALCFPCEMVALRNLALGKCSAWGSPRYHAAWQHAGVLEEPKHS